MDRAQCCKPRNATSRATVAFGLVLVAMSLGCVEVHVSSAESASSPVLNETGSPVVEETGPTKDSPAVDKDGPRDEPRDAPPEETMASLLLDVVNGRRHDDGSPPIAWQPQLAAAAQAVADRLTAKGEVDDRLLSIDRVYEDLAEQDYDSGELSLGFAQISGPPASALTLWLDGDSATFDRLAQASLRDLGLGVGDVRGTPVYVVLAAVTTDDRLAREASALSDLDAARQQALQRVNAARREHGRRPVASSLVLDRAAQAYARDMLSRGFYGHYSPEGDDVVDRLRAADYELQRTGENVASGQPTVEQVMDGWMNSPPHRANILLPGFTKHGLGVAAGTGPDGRYGVLWVQIFATPR